MKRSTQLSVRPKLTPYARTPIKGVRKLVRPSFIQNAPQPTEVADHPVATKSIPFIVNYLNRLNIRINENDIAHPQPYRIQQLYYIFIDLMIPNRVQLLQEERDRVAELPHENIYAQELMDVVPIFKEIQHILQQIPFTDIKILDLTAPTQDRTQRILSVIISALSLKEEYSKYFDPYIHEANTIANEARDLSAQLESLINAKSDLKPKSIQEELDNERWERQNLELEDTLRELRKECDGLLAKNEELKVERHGLKDNLQTVQYETINELREDKALKEFVKIDADKYKSDIKQFEGYIGDIKKEEAELKESLPNTDNLLISQKSLIADLAKILETVENILAIRSNVIRHKKANDTLKQELISIKADVVEYETKLANAKKKMQIQESKTKQIETQLRKKREGIDEYMENHARVAQETIEQIQEKIRETSECQKERSFVQEQMDALLTKRNEKQEQLWNKYNVVSSILSQLLKQLESYFKQC